MANKQQLVFFLEDAQQAEDKGKRQFMSVMPSEAVLTLQVEEDIPSYTFTRLKTALRINLNVTCVCETDRSGNRLLVFTFPQLPTVNDILAVGMHIGKYINETEI